MMGLCDKISMETCVLLPEEFSLKVDKEPKEPSPISFWGNILPSLGLPPNNKIHPGINSDVSNLVRICAAKAVPIQSKFLPFSGTVRTDKLPVLSYLSAFDVRHRMGSYDEVVERAGKEVRLCNWVRFLTPSLHFSSEVNMVASKNRGSIIFEAIKEIPEGAELVAFLLPDPTENENISLSALSVLRNSLYRQTLDSIITEAPLDLSRSLLTPKTPSFSGHKIGHKNGDFEDESEPLSKAAKLDTNSDIVIQNSYNLRACVSAIRNSLPFKDPFHGTPLLPSFFPFGVPLPPSFMSPHSLSSISGISPPVTQEISTPRSSTPSPTLSPSSSSKHKDKYLMNLTQNTPKRRERTMLPCSECGKAFDRPSLLKRHMRTHTGEKPHVCDVCGKGFSTSSSLNTHRRIHSGEKPHQCGVCGKRFTASSNLYYHKMTHVKEKPHKCSLCTRSFPTPGDLRSHMFVHNGQWPHKCHVCGKGFSKLTNLRNHEALHTVDRHNNKVASDLSSSNGFHPLNASVESHKEKDQTSNSPQLALTEDSSKSSISDSILPSPPPSPCDGHKRKAGDEENHDDDSSRTECLVDFQSASMTKQTEIMSQKEDQSFAKDESTVLLSVSTLVQFGLAENNGPGGITVTENLKSELKEHSNN